MNKILSLISLSLLAVTATGCKNKYIDSVTFKLSSNLESARVALWFNQSIKYDFGGTYLVKDYGSVFANPATNETAFNVGFDLNLQILNDQEYATYKPTTTLPTGNPLPSIINRALAEITLKKAPSDKFDVYAYIDVPNTISKGEWLGSAVTIKFTDKYIPAGLVVSENFLNDKHGNPRASALFFGPKLDENGAILISGGIAVFANVRALVQDADVVGYTLSSDPTILFEGSLLRKGNATLF